MSVRAEDLGFVSDMQRALLEERRRGPRWVLLLVAALLVGAFAWAAGSRVEEITQGPARVVPSSREQLVQSLEGGIVQALLVHEGDVVAQGQALLRIDPTKADAAFSEGRSKAMALRAMSVRLAAESRGVEPQFTARDDIEPAVIDNERRNFAARRRALDEALETLRRSQALLAREIDMTAPMVERGLVAEVELLRMRRQRNDLEMQLAERRNRFRAEAASELARVEAELAQVSGNLTARKDQVDRTVLRSPVRGTVSNLRITTVGGVIQPGQAIMEIVPLDEQLLVEARIAPRDVAFIRPGLPATVKLTAYDYTVYGALRGKVEMISADALADERRPDDSTYYRVLVRTEGSLGRAGGPPLAVIPGMTATVEVRTGEKTVLDYLLKPMRRGREALRER
ncbi:MAG: HlyD family type I secretion periplasmic adaptor subunit [Steroidobacteraceae bacterium]